MNNAVRCTVAASFCLFAAVLADGQQQIAAPAASNTIAIGQPIEDAKRILKDRGVEFGDFGFQISNSNPDITQFYCVLDERSAQAAIFYSKSKQTVTGLSAVFSPAGNPGKSTETWLSAKSVTFEPDGSYMIHFLPPRKIDPAAPKPKNVYPADTLPKKP